MSRLLIAVLFVVPMLCVPSNVLASTIDFSFGDLGLVFDGTTLQDSNLEGADEVIIITVRENGVLVPDSPLLGSAKIDLMVPDLTPLSTASGSSIQGGGGFLTMEGVGGEMVALSLESVQLQYNDFGGFAQFVFGGAVAEVVNPTSPQTAGFNSGAGISFSANISEQTTSGSLVTSFTAQATGEVEGATIVPEPAAIVTVGLMAMAASAAAAIRGKLG